MNRILCLVVCLAAFLFAEEKLPVYKTDNPSSQVIGYLTVSDKVEELPIPPKKKKVVKYVKQRDSKKKKRVVQYVDLPPGPPPEYIPVKTRFAKKGYVRRADLARMKERATDLSGIYSSPTGSVVLTKSPNSPGRFNIVIQNGHGKFRAAISMGNVQAREQFGHTRFSYSEPGCNVDVDLFERRVRVAQKGCEEYNSSRNTLSGNYDEYKEYRHRAEVFNDPEVTAKFRKFVWCPEGPSSCEKIRDEDGCDVEIVWSKDSRGMIERHCDDRVHKYRPMESMIPHKQDFYNGEKPIMVKAKRTDMANEWMIWSYYPEAKRFKMVRQGMRADAAYMEIYEP